MRTTILLLPLALLPQLLPGQGRPPVRFSLDDRLAAIEDRLAALEERVAAPPLQRAQPPQTDRLTLESQARLDRLEVRVIQLETASGDCGCNGVGERALLDRLRSLERQVARLRASIR